MNSLCIYKANKKKKEQKVTYLGCSYSCMGKIEMGGEKERERERERERVDKRCRDKKRNKEKRERKRDLWYNDEGWHYYPNLLNYTKKNNVKIIVLISLY